jgi:hypothetical protein
MNLRRTALLAAMPALMIATMSTTPAEAAVGHGSYTIINGTNNYVTAGHNLWPNGIDDAVLKVTLPFTVNLYGSGPRTSVWVSSNGNLQFGNTPSSSWSNDCLPTTQLSGPIIMPFWDDLFFNPQSTSGDGVFTATKGRAPHRSFVISWHGRFFASSTALVRAEVIFYEGNTSFDTRYLSGDTSSATIGVQGIPSSSQWSCDVANAVFGGENLRFNYTP